MDRIDTPVVRAYARRERLEIALEESKKNLEDYFTIKEIAYAKKLSTVTVGQLFIKNGIEAIKLRGKLTKYYHLDDIKEVFNAIEKAKYSPEVIEQKKQAWKKNREKVANKAKERKAKARAEAELNNVTKTNSLKGN